MKSNRGFIELGLAVFYFIVGVTALNAGAGNVGKHASVETPVQVAATK